MFAGPITCLIPRSLLGPLGVPDVLGSAELLWSPAT
jgi:hypothetical protein